MLASAKPAPVHAARMRQNGPQCIFIAWPCHTIPAHNFAFKPLFFQCPFRARLSLAMPCRCNQSGRVNPWPCLAITGASIHARTIPGTEKKKPGINPGLCHRKYSGLRIGCASAYPTRKSRAASNLSALSRSRSIARASHWRQCCARPASRFIVALAHLYPASMYACSVFSMSGFLQHDDFCHFCAMRRVSNHWNGFIPASAAFVALSAMLISAAQFRVSLE